MRMQVKAETDFIEFDHPNDKLFDCEDLRLSLWARICIKSIQILALGISSKISLADSVWIDDGYNVKYTVP